MDLSGIGEFGLIDRLSAQLGGEPPPGETWIGDDAAVVGPFAGPVLLTTDLLVEGIHFNLEWTTPEALGWKCLAVSCSDIAAMGGTPHRALVSLCVPPGTQAALLEGLYAGMRECCARYGLSVVGGDISRAPVLAVCVALLGVAAASGPVRRSGAQPGDAVCVTGRLGASAAALRLLQAGYAPRADLAAAHERPTPRVEAGAALAGLGATAMIDVSDGLAADLGHLCTASGVGARIEAEALPVPDLSHLPVALDPIELALHGGEDYELCFTVPPARVAQVVGQAGVPVAVVGAITADPGLVLTRAGVGQVLEAKGWDHFR